MSFDSEKSFVMAERLKQLREKSGLSHDRLSKTLFSKYGVKISPDSLINYEVADANHTKAYKNQGMRIEYLRCLADFYSVSTDYLLGLTPIKSKDTSVQDMAALTGLTEQSIEYLALVKKIQNRQATTPFIEETIEHDLYAEQKHLEFLLAESTDSIPEEIQAIMDSLGISELEDNKALIMDTALQKSRELTARNSAQYETLTLDAINRLIEGEEECKTLHKIALYLFSLPQIGETHFRICEIGLSHHFFPLGADALSSSFLTEVDASLKELRKHTKKKFDVRTF